MLRTILQTAVAVLVADPKAAEIAEALQGSTGRTEYPKVDRADDFEQAGLLYRLMDEAERTRLVSNIAEHLSNAGREIQKRQVEHFVAAIRSTVRASRRHLAWRIRSQRTVTENFTIHWMRSRK
jgi:catalase